MKKIFLSCIAMLFFAMSTYAQKDLPIVYIKDDLSIHFISPEPIQYVDISTHNIVGDLPVKNILRIKTVKDSLENVDFGFVSRDVAVLTIVGEKFMAQYNVRYMPDKPNSKFETSIQIIPDDMQHIDNPDVTMSENEMRAYAMDIIKRKRSFKSVSSKAYGIEADLNNIYTVGDFVF